jgi:hypothetical protein
MEKLKRAIDKFENKNNLYLNYKAPINEFLLDCYINCDPSSYGAYIQKKVEQDCKSNGLGVVSLSPKENKGDFEILVHYCNPVPTFPPMFKFDYVPDYKIPTLNFEFKCSYLGKTNGYTIRNIRPYQKMYGGYIICLVDCENNFREEFHLVKYETLSVIFNMTHMNGTASQHEKGGFKNYGISFKKDSYEHDLLREYSILNGDTMNDLLIYLSDAEDHLRETIMKDPKVVKYMNEKTFECTTSFCYGKNSIYYNEDILTIDEFKTIINNTFLSLKGKYKRLGDMTLSCDPLSYKITFNIMGVIGFKEYVNEVNNESLKEFNKQVSLYYNK